MTGVALAVGSTAIGVGTSIAGSASAKNGAKNAANATIAGNTKANQALFEQLMNSNNALQSGFNSNLPVQQGVLNASLGYQNPYSSAGQTALQSLMGQIAPREARAESGTNPQEAARIQAQAAQAAQVAQAKQQRVESINQQLQGLQWPANAQQIVQLQAQLRDATTEMQNANNQSTVAQAQVQLIIPYQAAQDAVLPQDATFSRQFTEQDYRNDPTTGGNAPPDLTKNFTMADYEADPGYQFRLDQGNKAINNSAAARGGLLSGATLKAITEYNSGAASQEYGNAVNRFNVNRANASDVYQNAYSRWNDQNNTIFNRLSSLSGMGQTAATNQAGYQQNYGANMQNAQQNLSTGIANNYQNYGTNQANLLANNGQALSNQAIQNANATGGMYQGIGNALNSGVTNATGAYMQNQTNDLLKKYLMKSGAI